LAVKQVSKLKAAVRRHWRRRAREEMERRGMPIPADFREEQPDDGDLNPPDAARVARRAACLAAVALRGLAGTWADAEQREFLPDLLAWFEQAGLDGEVEPGEREVIKAPAGELDQRALVNACWRWEGAAVLAASLGRLALPPHDQLTDTKACGDACGIFASREQINDLVRSAAFDDSFDRLAYADQAVAVHWRLRQFVNVEQNAIDFATYARGVEWTTFDLRGVRLVEGDLAIGDLPISRATPDDVGTLMSIASERHIAANWLIGWDDVYGDVENPT
jgi:hypothetical protein